MPSVSVPTVTQTAGGENLYAPAGGAGPSGTIVGTANQITALTASGVTTLSLASPSPAPSSLPIETAAPTSTTGTAGGESGSTAKASAGT